MNPRILLPALLPALLLAAALLPLRAAPPTAPEPTRAQQERLNTLLLQAESDPAAALAAALAVPIPERDRLLWRFIGDTHAARDAWAPALNAYEAALELFPADPDILLNLTQAALADNRPDRAIPLLQSALQAGLTLPRLHLALATLAEAAEDLLLAENAYRHTILLDAESLPAREGLARTLIAQQRFAEADPLIRALLDAHPRRAGLWTLYADLAQSQQDYPLAVQRLETARRLDLARPADLKRLAELYAHLDRPLEVLRIYRDVPDLHTDTPFRLRLAETLLQLGHPDPAREFLAGLPESPDAPETALRLTRIRARLLLLDNQPADAARLLETALRDHPLDPALLRLAGEAWLQADRPREAVPHFERLARQPGHEARALWYQGIALARAGDLAPAAELLEAARRIEDLPGLRQSLEQLRRMQER
jgi:tetratricopeptide (TPR) repeat protein